MSKPTCAQIFKRGYAAQTKQAVERKTEAKTESSEDGPVQQDDVLRTFMLMCVEQGLEQTWEFYGDSPPDFELSDDEDDDAVPSPIGSVLVVGAGPAGLAAARELQRTGYEVTIIEMSGRVGGRCFTVGGDFSDNPGRDGHTWNEPALHVEGGAMRLPGPVPAEDAPPSELWSHYLTDWYNVELGVPQSPFKNQDNTYKYIFGDVIKSSVWNQNPKSFCDTYWPGWDDMLSESQKAWLQGTASGDAVSVGVGGLYGQYITAVMNLIKDVPRQGEEAERKWAAWVHKWSQISVREYLLFYENWRWAFEEEPYLSLPNWLGRTLAAFEKSAYFPLADQSLVLILRDELGQWWIDPMHTPTAGMQALPTAMATDCTDEGVTIIFNQEVIKITDNGAGSGVQVTAREVGDPDTGDGPTTNYTADKVVVTTPLPIFRQLEIDPPLPSATRTAMGLITYAPSTKICVEYNTRFWEESQHGDDGIKGGTSQTTDVAGQIVYPTTEANIPDTNGGILVSYTWNQDASILGGGTAVAVKSVRETIANMHGLTAAQEEGYYESHYVQAWYNDRENQGAFAFYKPGEYNEFFDEILDNYGNIFIAGEASSWSNGWIQGALESGVRAAYQIFSESMMISPEQAKKKARQARRAARKKRKSKRRKARRQA